MRSRKILIVAGFLATWTYVIFYFMPKVNTEFPLLKNRRQQTLQKLEDGAREEFHKTDKLTINLLGILQAKFADELTLPSTPEKEIRIQPLPNNPQTILSLQEPPANEQGQSPQQQQQESQDQQEVLEMPNETETSAPPSEAPATVVTRLANNQPVIPVLVFACNRVSISKCLDNLIKYRPNAEQFPIIVSQDCGDEATRNVILSYDQQVCICHNILVFHNSKF